MNKGRNRNEEREEQNRVKAGTEMNNGRNRNEERRNRVVDRVKGPCFVSTPRNETTSFSSNFCYAFEATVKNLMQQGTFCWEV